MQANRCCCSFQAKTSQQAQPPGVDICTVYWPCQAIFSASCYFKLASGVFCVTKFKRVDVDMFILIRSKKYASLYTTRVCAGIFRLPISIGNQVSRDNLETVGPIWMIPTSAPLKFKFQSRYGQIDPPRQACVHARNFFVSRIAHFGQFWPKCASVFLWKIFPLMGNSCNLQELKKNPAGSHLNQNLPRYLIYNHNFLGYPVSENRLPH